MITSTAARHWFLRCAYVAAALYFTWPLLRSWDHLGIADWDALLFQHAAVFKTVFEYGQWPFWNPWYCGGNVLWQNPQSPLISPVHLFAPFVSVAAAMKLNILIHYLIGFAGMHVLLTRRLGLTWRPGIFFLACTFVLAGSPALHLIVGHSPFMAYFYFPWLFVLWLRAQETTSVMPWIGAAALLAVMVYGGSIYMVVLWCVAMGIFSLAAALIRRSLRPIVVMTVIGVLACLMAAPKLVPLVLHLGAPEVQDIRHFHQQDVTPLRIALHAFVDPFQYPRMTMGGQLYGWHEYGNYLGFLGAPLILCALLSLPAAWRKDRRDWLLPAAGVTTVVLFALMLGDFGAWAPYTWLQSLPPLANFRVPSRYAMPLVLFGVVVVAAVARRVADEPREAPRAWARPLAILLALSVWSLVSQNAAHFIGAFPFAPLASNFSLLSKPPAPTLDVATAGGGTDSPMLRGLADNRSVVECYEPLILRGTIDPARPLVSADAGTRVSAVTFTPNRITFEVLAGEAPGRVWFNSRMVGGWRVSSGQLTTSEGRLPLITLPPWTAGRIELRYTPPGIVPGMILWLLGVSGAGAAWYRERRRRTPRSAPAPAATPR